MQSPRGAAVVLAMLHASCASGPSPRWTQGGAAIEIVSAYWSDEESTVEIHPGGEVREGDQLLFKLDRKGRISTADGTRVAVLLPDGSLVAEDDAVLGWVHGGSSFRADRYTPAVYMFPTGQVVVADEDGRWTAAGQWVHCDGLMRWTCTLVTHVLAAREQKEGSGGGGSGAGQALELLRLLELLKLAR
jgi:hypothetical protein